MEISFDIKTTNICRLAFASNSWCSLLHILGGFLFRLRFLGCWWCGGLLGGFHGLLCVLCNSVIDKQINLLVSIAIDRRQFRLRLAWNRGTYLMACSRWAFRTSGFMLRLAMISVNEAPTIARWNFCVRRVRFLASSSSIPFLCLRL